MTRKANVSNAPDLRNAQMNDALVKALDPQLARIAPKDIANHKSTALEPQFSFAQLVAKIHQEDITRTHIDRHKLTQILLFPPQLITSPMILINSQSMMSMQWNKILHMGPT